MLSLLVVLSGLDLAFASNAQVSSCTVGAEAARENDPSALRRGDVLIQTKRILSASSMNENDDPDVKLYNQLSTQMTSMEERVQTLESKSAKGREELETGLAALRATVDAIRSAGSGTLGDAGARVTVAEKQLVELEGSVGDGNAELRNGIDALKASYDGISRSIGDRPAASLQQERSEQTPEGETLRARTTALEGRVQKLETESAQGRDELTKDLVMMDKAIHAIESGGADSLEYVAGRVTSAQRQVTSLQASVDDEHGGLQADLEALEAKVDHLMGKLGASSSLIQLVQDPTKSGTDKLPLAKRIYSLFTRIQQLEEKSDQGRDDLSERLQLLLDKVERIKGGGVSSLEHTILREATTEGEITKLQTSVAERKSNLAAAIQSVGSKLTEVSSLVGA